MKMIDLTCPSCRAQMFMDLVNRRAYCEHCGRVMMIDDDQKLQGYSNDPEDAGYLFEKGRQRALKEAEAERARNCEGTEQGQKQSEWKRESEWASYEAKLREEREARRYAESARQKAEEELERAEERRVIAEQEALRQEKIRKEQEAMHRKSNSGRNRKKTNVTSTFAVFMVLFFFCLCCCSMGNNGSNKITSNNKEVVNGTTVTGAFPADTTSVWAAKPTSIDQFEYKTNPYDKQIIISSYEGKESKVWIAGEYSINGEVYQVDLGQNFKFGLYSKVTSVIVGDGIQTVAYDCFSGKSIKYIYIPGSVQKARYANGIFSSLVDGQEVYYGGTNREFFEYTETVDENKIKFIPVYVKSKIRNDGIGVEKGVLYDKNAAVTESEIPDESVSVEETNDSD